MTIFFSSNSFRKPTTLLYLEPKVKQPAYSKSQEQWSTVEVDGMVMTRPPFYQHRSPRAGAPAGAIRLAQG